VAQVDFSTVGKCEVSLIAAGQYNVFLIHSLCDIHRLHIAVIQKIESSPYRNKYRGRCDCLIIQACKTTFRRYSWSLGGDAFPDSLLEGKHLLFWQFAIVRVISQA